MAIAAAVLAGCLVGLILAVSLVVAAHPVAVREYAEVMSSADGLAEMVKAQAEFYEAHGGVPSWMLAVVAMEGAMALVWIATLVCGILAVRRPHRRAPAIAALVVVGLTLVMFCAGVLGM